jgi:hypothetical protein
VRGVTIYGVNTNITSSGNSIPRQMRAAAKLLF